MTIIGDPIVQVLAGLLFVLIVISAALMWRGWQKDSNEYTTAFYEKIRTEQDRWVKYVRTENFNGRLVLPKVENGLYYDPDGSVFAWPAEVMSRRKTNVE